MELYNHANRPSTGLRKAIPGTCALHRGPIGFANLMVIKRGDSVVLDPHVTGSGRDSAPCRCLTRETVREVGVMRLRG
jgi:hypothetical protein